MLAQLFYKSMYHVCMYVCMLRTIHDKYYKHIIIIHVYIIIQVCHLQGDVLQKQRKVHKRDRN